MNAHIAIDLTGLNDDVRSSGELVVGATPGWLRIGHDERQRVSVRNSRGVTTWESLTKPGVGVTVTTKLMWIPRWTTTLSITIAVVTLAITVLAG